MKKRKINLSKFLKIGIIFFGISLLLNCEKEVTNNNELPIKSINKKSYNRTSLELLKNDKLFTRLTSEFAIEPLFDTKFNKEKSSNKNNQHIIIITDTIAVVEKENYKSYTFLIKTPNQKYNLVKNLILEQKGNEINAFILNYDFDLQWLNDYTNDIHNTPKAKITLTPFNISTLNKESAKTSSQTCSWVTVTITSPCGCGHYYRRQCRGCSSYPTFPSVYTSTQYVCENGGGDNSGSEFLPTSSTEIGLVFGSNSGNSNNNSETNLMMDDIAELEVYRVITECIQENSNLSSISVSQRADIANFIQQNGCSSANSKFVENAIEILSLPELSSNETIDTFKNRILKITSNLKQWGNLEDEIFAEYVESLVQDFNLMTVGDVYDIYKLADKQSKILIWKYAAAVIVPVAETAYPFIVYAVSEATLGAALPLLSRIPLAAVIRGAKLNNMVRQLAKLGKAGTSSRIRLIPNGSYEKSLVLFNKITQNSVSPVTTTTTANGRIIKVADMGNGNYITFRNFDNSGTSNLVANIDLKFPSIWSKTRELKFIN